jgi:hypothetical protein
MPHRSIRLAALLAALSCLPWMAAAYDGPLFDAHVHYNDPLGFLPGRSAMG